MKFDELIVKYIPNDFSRQISLELFTERILVNLSIQNVLDLGCGIGDSADLFLKTDSKIVWTGVDIENSPEAMSRLRQDLNFIIFDGIKLPFKDNYFDLIYCRQVLEHVRYPDRLLKEVRRVLKPEGLFIGSTSHLEPYHSNSYWNYTPYGFVTLLDEASLLTKELRPSIDSMTLILRRIFRGTKLFNIFWKIDSPLNAILELLGRALHKSVQWRIIVKLLFCGQFLFLATKPSD